MDEASGAEKRKALDGTESNCRRDGRGVTVVVGGAGGRVGEGRAKWKWFRIHKEIKSFASDVIPFPVNLNWRPLQSPSPHSVHSELQMETL